MISARPGWGAPKPIIILGTGGNCIDILDTIGDINRAAAGNAPPMYDCIGFLDDNRAVWEADIHGVKVLGPLERAHEFDQAWFINGIGSEGDFWRKDAIIGRTGIPPERFESIVHPTASVSRMSTLGRGVVIFQNVTVTSNVRIGDHVVVLPNTIVSHDAVVGDYSIITGGVCVSGRVTVGRSCYLGTNSTIRPNVVLGEHTLVGMGSVVLDDVPPNTVVVGNPARFLRHTTS